MVTKNKPLRWIELTVAQREALDLLADGAEHEGHSGRTDPAVGMVNAVACYALVDRGLVRVHYRRGEGTPRFTVTPDGAQVAATKPRFA